MSADPPDPRRWAYWHPRHQAPAHIWPVQVDHHRAKLLGQLLHNASTTFRVQAARGTPGAEQAVGDVEAAASLLRRQLERAARDGHPNAPARLTTREATAIAAMLGRTADRLDAAAAEPGWAAERQHAATLRAFSNDLASAAARPEPTPAQRDTARGDVPTSREAGHER
jgi:hypothetical protein